MFDKIFLSSWPWHYPHWNSAQGKGTQTDFAIWSKLLSICRDNWNQFWAMVCLGGSWLSSCPQVLFEIRGAMATPEYEWIKRYIDSLFFQYNFDVFCIEWLSVPIPQYPKIIQKHFDRFLDIASPLLQCWKLSFLHPSGKRSAFWSSFERIKLFAHLWKPLTPIFLHKEQAVSHGKSLD